jgi:hypothetical protein
MGWVRQVFSENGQGSWSRVQSAMHMVGCMGWVTHFVVHTHTLPDAMTLTGLTAFVTAPYAAGKAAGALSTFSNGNGHNDKAPS